MVACVIEFTTLVVTWNVVLVLPAGTVAVPPAGTCAELELLETLTAAPPTGAIPVRVIVAVEDWPPLTVPGFRLNDCRLGGAFAMLKVAVSVSVPPAESVTTCVMVCVPLGASAVFQGLAAAFGEPVTLPM